MKKVVLGLLAFSVVALAAPPEGYPQPGQPQGEPPQQLSYIVKQVPLSTCYIIPQFDETKDLREGSVSFNIVVGYILRKNFLLLVVDSNGNTLYERRISKDENKFQTWFSPSWNTSNKEWAAKKAAARAEVIEYYQQWVNERRQFLCAQKP